MSQRRFHSSSAREVLYGRQPVREALRAGRRQVFRLHVLQSAKPTPELDDLLGLARRGNVPVTSTDQRHLEGLAGAGNHQGVVAEVSAYPYVDLDRLRAELSTMGEPPLLLLLDHIEDPQNLGSLLRSADAAGVHGAIVPADRAAAVTPAAVRASAGGAEHLAVCMVVNLVRAMCTLKEDGVWLCGLEGRPEATLCTERDLTGALGLVVGSEGRGLGRLVRETCDFLVRLPMRGKVASLNAGVAGGIALFEIRRQREAGRVG